MTLSSLDSDSGTRFRVAICGAGIAGLVLAITIAKYDPSIPIDVYEAHESIGASGVGITLRRDEVLMELGLFDAFKQISTHKPESKSVSKMRRSDKREGGYTWCDRVHGHNMTIMHRQQMIDVLGKHLPTSCTVHLRKRLAAYTEPEQQETPIVLEFTDGTTATADLLIGADGVRSAVRKMLFEMASDSLDDGGDEDKTELKQCGVATFTGMTAYRCLIPAETLRKECPENRSLMPGLTLYHGKGKFVITYLVAKGTIVNFVGTIADPSLTGTEYKGRWVSDATHDELVEHFDEFEPDVREIVKLCEKPSKWALHVVKPLPFCVRKRVALIGDACHAMTPHHGAGAGQAIEDAFVLGRLIAHPITTLRHIPDVLQIYEEVRLPIARDVANLSLSSGWLSSFMEPGFYDGTRKEDNLDDEGISAYERDGMEMLKQEFQRQWDWLDRLESVMQTWEEAELKLLGGLTE